MLTAQVLSTNAFYRQVQQERKNVKTTQTDNETWNTKREIMMLQKMVDALNKEIATLKSNI